MRVVIADDNAARAGAASHLRGDGARRDAQCRWRPRPPGASRRRRPDVAIVDIRMPPTHTDEGCAARDPRRHPEVGDRRAVAARRVRHRGAHPGLQRAGTGRGPRHRHRRVVCTLHRVHGGGTAPTREVDRELAGGHRPLDVLRRASARCSRRSPRPTTRPSSPTAPGTTLRSAEKHASSIFSALDLPGGWGDRRVLAASSSASEPRPTALAPPGTAPRDWRDPAGSHRLRTGRPRTSSPHAPSEVLTKPRTVQSPRRPRPSSRYLALPAATARVTPPSPLSAGHARHRTGRSWLSWACRARQVDVVGICGADRPRPSCDGRGRRRSPASSTRRSPLSRSSGFIFQFFNLLRCLMAEENIALPLRSPAHDATGLEAGARHGRGTAARRPARPQALRSSPVASSSASPSPAPCCRARRSFSPTSRRATSTRDQRRVYRLLRHSVDAFGQTVAMVTHDPRAATSPTGSCSCTTAPSCCWSSAHENPRDVDEDERPMIGVALRGSSPEVCAAHGVRRGDRRRTASGTLIDDTMQKVFDGITPLFDARPTPWCRARTAGPLRAPPAGPPASPRRPPSKVRSVPRDKAARPPAATTPPSRKSSAATGGHGRRWRSPSATLLDAQFTGSSSPSRASGRCGLREVVIDAADTQDEVLASATRSRRRRRVKQPYTVMGAATSVTSTLARRWRSSTSRRRRPSSASTSTTSSPWGGASSDHLGAGAGEGRGSPCAACVEVQDAQAAVSTEEDERIAVDRPRRPAFSSRVRGGIAPFVGAFVIFNSVVHHRRAADPQVRHAADAGRLAQAGQRDPR